jgi:choline-glycine betaine transporter
MFRPGPGGSNFRTYMLPNIYNYYKVVYNKSSAQHKPLEETVEPTKNSTGDAIRIWLIFGLAMGVFVATALAMVVLNDIVNRTFKLGSSSAAALATCVSFVALCSAVLKFFRD